MYSEKNPLSLKKNSRKIAIERLHTYHAYDTDIQEVG